MFFTWPKLAFIGDVGGGEMMLIFLVVLMLFGGEKMPELARGVGKALREFKKATSGVEEQIKQAMAEAPPPKPRPAPAPTPSLPPAYTPPPAAAITALETPPASAAAPTNSGDRQPAPGSGPS